MSAQKSTSIQRTTYNPTIPMTTRLQRKTYSEMRRSELIRTSLSQALFAQVLTRYVMATQYNIDDFQLDELCSMLNTEFEHKLTLFDMIRSMHVVVGAGFEGNVHVETRRVIHESMGRIRNYDDRNNLENFQSHVISGIHKYADTAVTRSTEFSNLAQIFIDQVQTTNQFVRGFGLDSDAVWSVTANTLELDEGDSKGLNSLSFKTKDIPMEDMNSVIDFLKDLLMEREYEMTLTPNRLEYKGGVGTYTIKTLNQRQRRGGKAASAS